MNQFLTTLQSDFGMVSQQTLLLASLGLGVLIAFYATVSLLGGDDAASRRLKSAVAANSEPASTGLRRRSGKTPIRGLMPTDEQEYSNAARLLQNAGFRSENAVRNFYLLRTGVGIVLPVVLVLLWLVLGNMTGLPQITQKQLLYAVLGLVVIGFYGPSFVVRKRTKERRLRILEGFPNALDLMQISMEAGLGFDAAMNRVAVELSRSNPEIAEEFAVAQREVAAGRDRDKALLEMAQRTDVPEVTSFVTVMLQSMEFGTSVSQALITYSRDMRTRRELKAVEKANKLPVTMSITLVMFMLPALLCLVLSPIAINWIRLAPFGN